MDNTKFDHFSIVAKVDKELKKCGAFDRIRKQATENIKESSMAEIEKETLKKVDEIMEKLSNSSTHEIQRKVRDYIENNPKLREEITGQIKTELEKDWVKDTLNQEVEDQVNKQLADLV